MLLLLLTATHPRPGGPRSAQARWLRTFTSADLATTRQLVSVVMAKMRRVGRPLMWMMRWMARWKTDPGGQTTWRRGREAMIAADVELIARCRVLWLGRWSGSGRWHPGGCRVRRVTVVHHKPLIVMLMPPPRLLLLMLMVMRRPVTTNTTGVRRSRRSRQTLSHGRRRTATKRMVYLLLLLLLVVRMMGMGEGRV